MKGEYEYSYTLQNLNSLLMDYEDGGLVRHNTL